MKRKILLIACIVFSGFSFSQIPSSFYLNHGAFKLFRYTNDALYFLNDSNQVDKVDYEGHSIWSIQFPSFTDDFLIQDQNIYALSDSKLLKLDTSGNFIWAYDFSGPLCVNLYPHGISSDNSHLYIFCTSNQFVGAGVITIDTSGNLINSWCDPAADQFVDKGFQRLNGGTWIRFRDLGTGTSDAFLVRADINGNIDGTVNCIFQYYGSNDDVLDVIPLPDSTYIALDNTSSTWDGSIGNVCLTRFSDDGIILWSITISKPDFCMSVQSMGIDSSGNIYVIGESNNDFSFNFFSLKVDIAGNLLNAYKWTEPQSLFYPYSYSRMAYHNGYMYFAYNLFNSNECIMSIDTSLNFVCPIAKTTDTLLSFYPQIPDTFSWLPGFASTYTMVNAVASSQNNWTPAVSDLCILLSTHESALENEFELSPNPAHDKLRLSVSLKYGEAEITILNSLGTRCLQTAISALPAVIDVHSLSPGIYFVKLQNEDSSSVQKLIVE